MHEAQDASNNNRVPTVKCSKILHKERFMRP